MPEQVNILRTERKDTNDSAVTSGICEANAVN